MITTLFFISIIWFFVTSPIIYILLNIFQNNNLTFIAAIIFIMIITFLASSWIHENPYRRPYKKIINPIDIWTLLTDRLHE